jgi:cobalamin biosynthesis protein CobD/CbiB
MFNHTIESWLSLEFCEKWARKWRNTGFIDLSILTFMLSIQAWSVQRQLDLPTFIFYFLVDMAVVALTVDSFVRSRAFRKRANELKRKGVPGW